ncbi:MAG: hypothetical protein HY820_32860 [Acidobacteria bacterium]|nr:hypothetical protein [Acidobacteriota bacterium]
MDRYNIARSYDWNYEHVPAPVDGTGVPPCPGNWRFCGYAVNSPLGVPAGPLLNSGWIRYYAGLGFDVLTYKTVRSAYRACYDLPNLLPVSGAPLDSEGRTLVTTSETSDSWAISFGMPSKDPAVWMADVAEARRALGSGQVLVVSVVASPQPGWGLEEVAEDFALCARWAKEVGAMVVEPNLSCPNVCTQEADLYLSAEASARIAEAVRTAVEDLPVALKVGLFPDRDSAARFVKAVAGKVTAICATNSITARVSGADGELLFGGLRRGIGGAVIQERCLEETRMLAELIQQHAPGTELVSVGGVRTAADVRTRLEAGATHVQIATAAMLDPEVAMRIRGARGVF